MTLDGFIVAVGGPPTVLEVDDTVVEKETPPVNRLNVLTVMSEFADWLDRTARLLGLALSSKSEDVFEILHKRLQDVSPTRKSYDPTRSHDQRPRKRILGYQSAICRLLSAPPVYYCRKQCSGHSTKLLSSHDLSPREVDACSP